MAPARVPVVYEDETRSLSRPKPPYLSAHQADASAETPCLVRYNRNRAKKPRSRIGAFLCPPCSVPKSRTEVRRHVLCFEDFDTLRGGGRVPCTTNTQPKALTPPHPSAEPRAPSSPHPSWPTPAESPPPHAPSSAPQSTSPERYSTAYPPSSPPPGTAAASA